ncbi:ESF1 homolog [Cimex lectularius]|uniref:ESF1 homolog n=1 Tax=Cimex lectularius TaxID=79782 RepID=A0A8I6TMT0_CIMLE|nr:ESF1 homolog [Cimex lectularius]
MDEISKDKRFRHVATDPRFKKVPRSEYKVKIDKRFQSMFTDERFQLKYSVDKRGRPVNETQADNYKKYYDLAEESGSEGDDNEENGDQASVESSQEESDDSVTKGDEEANDSDNQLESNSEVKNDDQSEKPELTAKSKHKEEKKRLHKLLDEEHKSRMNDTVKERLQDMTVDYARGIGMLQSESSSDEPSSDESESEFIEHAWGELDKDAEQTDEVTKRLAACHMDWDRIKAKDIMILFHSFLPADGVIESVTIYPSEFGLARMKEEELEGPKELVKDNKFEEFEEDFDEKHSEGRTYHRERLREYQLKRLKYYYAVIVCNTPETANKLYKECDGMEYESSATKIDLRFIPDDMTFDQEPREVCQQLPDLMKYKPRLFANTALQQGKVGLTWDETDPDRIEFNKKVVSGELKDDDLQAYIAASSDSDDGEPELDLEEQHDKDTQNLDPISKYKSLLADIQKKEDKKNNRDEEMEISWGAGMSSKVKISDKKDENTDDEEFGSSDDEIIKQKSIKTKQKGKKKHIDENEDENDENKAELELLLAGDEPEEMGKAHFNLKDIQKKERMEGKKKKWQKKQNKGMEDGEDNFKVDLADNRFSALYTSHHFNIDPADPHFKKTKGMTEFIAEKQKRRKLNPSDVQTVKDNSDEQLNPELSSLIKSIKQKSKPIG